MKKLEEQIVDGTLTKELELVKKIAKTDYFVLITGETGTGKELIAKQIHNFSQRNDKPLISINLSALSATLIESELLGHEKGAFTSALKQHIGRLERADTGTLFIDEIGDLSIEIQIKLLRLFQDNPNQTFERVGGKKIINTNVRIITATNQDLRVAIEQQKFRQDLFYRLNILNIHLPPLRERKHEIPILFNHFFPADSLTQEAKMFLKEHPWPGNVRELKNLSKRIMTYSDKQKLTKQDLIKIMDQTGESTEKKLILEQKQDKVQNNLISELLNLNIKNPIKLFEFLFIRHHLKNSFPQANELNKEIKDFLFSQFQIPMRSYDHNIFKHDSLFETEFDHLLEYISAFPANWEEARNKVKELSKGKIQLS